MSSSEATTDEVESDAGDDATTTGPTRAQQGIGLLQSFGVAVVAGGGLVLAARSGLTALVVAVAIVQALFAVSWVFGTAMPGRWGGLIIGALAAGGADVSVLLRTHDRLGPLLTVLGLAIPVIFIHQLLRGAARVQVVASMSAVAVLAVTEVALASLVTIRHEFVPASLGDKVVATSVAALAGAGAVGYLVDIVVPALRFDANLARGLPALVASAVVGGALGYLLLHGQSQFPGDRAAFLGAALGALAGLVAVAVSFVLHTTAAAGSPLAARTRPAVAALLPIMLLSPAAFLLSLAIRA